MSSLCCSQCVLNLADFSLAIKYVILAQFLIWIELSLFQGKDSHLRRKLLVEDRSSDFLCSYQTKCIFLEIYFNVNY